MDTRRLQFAAKVPRLLVTLLLCALAACQKPCQQPPTSPITSITANPWRLIQTSDPQASAVTDRFSFLIYTFTPDFQGQVQKVVNNTQYDTPVYVLKYNLASSGSSGTSGNLVVVYSTPAADPNSSGGSTTDPGIQSTSAPTNYTYSLSGQYLNLTDTTTGYTWQFVPFTGIVDPDSTCSFF